MSAPDVAGLAPAEQHAAVVQVLAEQDLAGTIRHGVAWRDSRDRAALLGRRAIVERHAPRTVHVPAAGGPLCERVCSAWPCTDYRHAAAGAVTGLGGRPQPAPEPVDEHDTCGEACAADG